ncbi:hypothetical protein CHELA1G11_10338 [Hyphomicrobiales bacterium]|nr:hypothetical protein CHELA1G11_10338 [Hyphomicrobiales bacterium]CAH1675379.1 hypothetical protein CHELA1G2_13967 [Hyphomicrobiales bacterium]
MMLPTSWSGAGWQCPMTVPVVAAPAVSIGVQGWEARVQTRSVARLPFWEGSAVKIEPWHIV